MLKTPVWFDPLADGLRDIDGKIVNADSYEVIRRINTHSALVEALEKLVEAADDSDGSLYGTLSTSFVRSIATEALKIAKE